MINFYWVRNASSSAHMLNRFSDRANCKYQDTSIRSIASMQNKHREAIFAASWKFGESIIRSLKILDLSKVIIAAKITKLLIFISDSRIDRTRADLSNEMGDRCFLIIFVSLSEAHPLKREKEEKFAKYISRWTRSEGCYQWISRANI